MKKNISRLILTMLAGSIGFISSTPAIAQNGQLSQAPRIISSMNVTELSAIMQSAGFTTALLEEDGANNKVIEASLEGAGVLYLTLMMCNGPGVAAPCELLQPYGLFDGTGVTLSQVNAFNLEQSNISLAGLMPDGSGLIGAKIYLVGGVSEQSFFNSMGLYLKDVDKIVAAITPGALADVSYAPAAKGSATGITYGASDLPGAFSKDRVWQVNSVGRNAPIFSTDAVSKILNQ